MVIPDLQPQSRQHTFQLQGTPLMLWYIWTIAQMSYQSGKLAIPYWPSRNNLKKQVADTLVERAVATFMVNKTVLCAFLIVVQLQRVSCRLQAPVTSKLCRFQQIAARVDRYDFERQR